MVSQSIESSSSPNADVSLPKQPRMLSIAGRNSPSPDDADCQRVRPAMTTFGADKFGRFGSCTQAAHAVRGLHAMYGASIPRSVLAHQTGLVRNHHELRPVTGPELDHGPADVGTRGRAADHQSFGDLVIAQSLTDQGKHLPFSIGQL